MRKKFFISIFALLLSFVWASAEKVTTPWMGVDYTFNLCDGSILPTTNPQVDSVDYGIFRSFKGTGSIYQYNGAQHGVEFKAGNYIELDVAGSVTVKIGGCQYSGSASTITVSDKNGTYTETKLSKTPGTCTATLDFVYSGPKTTLKIAFAVGKTYIPNIIVESADIISEPGETYSYNFADASVFTQVTTTKYPLFVTADGIVTMKSNSEATNAQIWWHDAQHGAAMYLGNSISIVVAGDAFIKVGTCQYSMADAVMEFTDASGNVLGSIPATDKGTGACNTHTFNYKGEAGTITGTLKSTNTAGTIYIHGVTIENAKAKTSIIDAWDFGAAQLDTIKYNNWLTASVINSWYDPTIVVGSTGNTLPATFTAGLLSWVGAANKDRLRTTNTNLTRYDASGAPLILGTDTLNGSLYVNASATTARYLTISASEDDEVYIYCKSQNAAGLINFVYTDAAIQSDTASSKGTGSLIKFVAKNTGVYKIYDTKDKPFYYRILRKDATLVKVTGTVDVTEAPGIPAGYKIEFKNSAGKSWNISVSSGAYSGKVPAGFEYSLSLIGANGYLISNGSKLTVEKDTTYTIAIKKVEIYTVSGSITGLNASQLSKVKLIYTPVANRIYAPETAVDAATATYTAKLEPNCQYIISASGVNDCTIPANTISISKADTTSNIAFEAKPVYAVTISTEGLVDSLKSKLNVVFTNLKESGYVYSFSDLNSIVLRDGVYSISCTGLDQYPIELGATSNLKVEGAATSKALVFKPVNYWPFDDATITKQNAAYKGLLFTGNIYNEKDKSHLVANGNASIKVPMNPGEKLTVTYYYTAKFSIEGGDTIVTATKSTSTIESVNYTYTGTKPGYVTIGTGSGTSYFVDLLVIKTVPYTEIITVGTDKDYQTINGALDAVRYMIRPNNERVKIVIDPGNYEEMLVVDVANVSLINATVKPSISLLNKGVDIDANAVRITSYYGHGYNYYSMAPNQKWSADALRVNKENGYTTYVNTGGASTNGSYWNATVVISAPGLEANNIIFENSFNQYISKKESEDVVKEWAVGGKGKRPTVVGSTDVQNKSFVERGAAIAIAKSGDKTVLNKCRVIGRQDSFYGAEGARVVAYKGSLMGGTDYIFGGMTLVAYKSELAMNTSEVSTDVSYITAAQQTTARGYLMYECTITSAKPGTETASAYLSKPGCLGRPWQGTTSEVVYYNTTIDSTNSPGFEGKSMITPEAWMTTLGGTSEKCYEYGTIEKSGVDNSANRLSWTHILTTPVLTDGTEINTFNFTKGTDNWDPIPALDEVVPDFKIENIVFGTVDSPEDFTGNLNLKWDATNVYMSFDIVDDSIVNEGNAWQVDNIEIYFDMDNSKNIHWPRNAVWASTDASFDTNDFQIRLVPGMEFSMNNTSVTGETQVYTKTENGYKFDLTIPWNSLMDGFVPSVGTLIGFDVLASDNDKTASDANRNQITLVCPTDKPFNDPSLFGTFQFEELNSFTIIPDEEAPGIATNLTATVAKNAVTLAWDNATDNIAILYYNVYQGTTLLPNKVYPTETGNTLKISKLDDGDYTFSLETVDIFGNVSATKASVNATVKYVSVNDLSASKLAVYPNPTISELNIKGVDNVSRIEVIGVTGNVVKTFNGSSTINVSSLSKGAYILKVYNNQEVLTTRFLKN
jgi:pectin methylesterase-like acyl-CoA thioesterase